MADNKNHMIIKNTLAYVAFDKLYVQESKNDEGYSYHPESSHWVKVNELDFLENT